MKKQKLGKVRAAKAVARQKREEEQPISARQHPLIELQGIIGNQGVQRLLAQRESDDGDKDDSSTARAERYIRQQIAYRDKLMTRAFETIEINLMPDERDIKLPMVQSVKNIHVYTGILTLEMLETLQNAIKPVKVAEYINQQFEFLWKDVKFKNEMLEALDDDPVKWQLEYMKRLAGH
jgi:hypothetical protein